ncbi:MAG: hypothetical protein RBU23_06960 [Candidatus Auribacterota bacterium]|jgi:ribonuclease Z|nr:hypothetical protein [Candidatus Auribacterota bacterium]
MNFLFPKPVGFFRDDHSIYVDVKNVQGKAQSILIDCGNNHTVSMKEFLRIGTLLVSHAHIDHLIGFDNILRMNLRENKRIRIIGPDSMANVIHHRLQGYMWNLIYDSQLEIEVWEISARLIKKYLFLCREGFSKKHFMEKIPAQNPVIKTDHYEIRYIRLNHDITSIGYSITEHDRFRIRKKCLREMGLPEGQWLKQLKNKTFSPNDTMQVNDTNIPMQSIYKNLIIHEPGFKLSYITDTILNNSLKKKITEFVKNSDQLYCEATFLHKDIKLARQYYHLTAKQTALIAKEADVKNLFLIHLSLRYSNPFLLLKEAQSVFPNTQFPVFSDSCMVKRKI